MENQTTLQITKNLDRLNVFFVNSGGIKLPIPYQIVSQDQIKSRLEPYALIMIMSKSNAEITKPETPTKPTSRAQLEHIT